MYTQCICIHALHVYMHAYSVCGSSQSLPASRFGRSPAETLRSAAQSHQEVRVVVQRRVERDEEPVYSVRGRDMLVIFLSLLY